MTVKTLLFLALIVGQVAAVNLQGRQISACKWYDVICLGGSATDSIKNHFDDFSSTLSTKFDKLGDATKSGLESAKSFAKMTLADVEALSSDMLAQSTAVAGMTVDQLKGVADKVNKMTGEEVKIFVSKLNKDTLQGALEDLGKVADWGSDQANEIIDRLEKDDMYGKIETWTKEAVKKTGNLVSGIKAKDLAKMANDLVSDAVVATKLTASQIADLVGKTGTMLDSEFKKFYDNVENKQLKAALKTMGKGLSWGRSKVKMLYDKLVEDDFFGDLSTWTEETFVLLGDLVGPIILEGEIKHINKDLFKRIGSQVVKAVVLADTFGDAVFETKFSILGDLATLGSSAFGSVAKQWTKEWVGTLGPAIIALTKLEELAGEVIMDAIPVIIANGFDWRTVKGIGKNFLIDRIKKSDACGIVSGWTKDQIEQLGDMLPTVVTDVDISQLNKETFLGATKRIKEIADNNGWDASQLKALANMAKAVSGTATKDWNADQMKQFGSIVSGLTIQDLKDLNSKAVAAIEPYATRVMNSDQLNALGTKLSELSDAAKNSVVGQKFLKLSKEAKQALLKCKADVDASKQKFVDVVVTFKDNAATDNPGEASIPMTKSKKSKKKNSRMNKVIDLFGKKKKSKGPSINDLFETNKNLVEEQPGDLENFIKQAAGSYTSTIKLPSVEDIKNTVNTAITYRFTYPTDADVQKAATAINDLFETNKNLVEEQLLVSARATAIEPTEDPKPETSGAITSAPTVFGVCVALSMTLLF